ncbi:ribosome-associated protein [Raineyella antarctica]|uniref:Ribosome-associated protein n=1 Tax=Raineyella antarctica TaxID=1577474 RepID=A0A1G6GQ56_9ACTN|nr:alternative ribosome rescue aminoacyl-tRNA hydrolase ArfB [Raineyella antarctica]SDB83346.1 ribosome-associated protein [Raineyella antarctica]
MEDLLVAPGPGLPEGLVIPGDLLRERFTHASGPGGQGVNTSDSRVQLSLDLAALDMLTTAQRERLAEQLAGRLADTILTVEAAEFRSQLRNRRAARERMAALLRTSLGPPPPPRRPTRPTRGSRRRRLETKHRRSEVKRGRSRPSADS